MAKAVAKAMASAIALAMANGWQRRYVRDMAPTPPKYLGGPSAYLTQVYGSDLAKEVIIVEVANAREPRR